jgi:uncharacterized membrane protein
VQTLVEKAGVKWLLLIFGINAARALLTVGGLLVLAFVIHQLFESARTGIGYRRILRVCAYAACLREAARLTITLGIVGLYGLMHWPLPLTANLTMKASALLNEHSCPRLLYELAKSLDPLALGFLLLVAIGLSKVVARLRPMRAAMFVLFAWLILVGVAAWGGHDSSHLFG